MLSCFTFYNAGNQDAFAEKVKAWESKRLSNDMIDKTVFYLFSFGVEFGGFCLRRQGQENIVNISSHRISPTFEVGFLFQAIFSARKVLSQRTGQ